jgi:hypothetical protein
LTNQPYAQGAYRAGYYPYPPSYSYYPTRSFPYGSKKSKLLYPAVLVLAGLLLIGYSFVQVEKLDPQISRIAAINPEMEVAAVVFCDPCTAVDGDSLGAGRVLVVDEAVNIRLLADMPGVKQVRMVGKI